LALIDERPGSATDDRPGPVPLDASAWRARLDDQRRSLRRSATAPDRRRRSSRGDLVALVPADPGILSALRAWRADAARASGVPAPVLVHDRTLAVLASLVPTTLEDLADVPGLGAVKIARYGPTLLSLIRASASARSAGPLVSDA
jgi:superfamily II DNA helicase RecQ